MSENPDIGRMQARALMTAPYVPSRYAGLRCLLRGADGFERIELLHGAPRSIIVYRSNDGVEREFRLDPDPLVERNGERLLRYNESKSTKPLPPKVVGSSPVISREPPKREDLARAIFRSDPRVCEFVGRVADAVLTRKQGLTFNGFSTERINRAFAVAWSRDEKGWRTDAFKRADQVLACLDSGWRGQTVQVAFEGMVIEGQSGPIKVTTG